MTMDYTITAIIIGAVFLAMPWLAVAFNRYCDAVNRFMARRRARH
jgi:ABC-type tungstate transport system substrate-binding protein